MNMYIMSLDVFCVSMDCEIGLESNDHYLGSRYHYDVVPLCLFVGNPFSSWDLGVLNGDDT
jgi:hypothetical protein